MRAYRASGQGAAEYAAARGLSAGTLCGWASKLKKGEPHPDSKRRFLPVRVTRSKDDRPIHVGASEFEVILCNGRRVRIAGEAPPDLAELLAMVEGGGRC